MNPADLTKVLAAAQGMTPAEILSLGKAGGAMMLGLAAIGSCIGAGLASLAAVGAWKKCFAQGKPAPFMLIAYVGAPLSQTLYGFIAMLVMQTAAQAQAEAAVKNAALNGGTPWVLLFAGIFGGLAIGASAAYQGKAAAASADAFAETGKGFGNNLMILGITETVAILVMAFTIMLVKFTAF